MTSQAASRTVTVRRRIMTLARFRRADALPLLALALLRPFLGDALDGADDGRGFHDRTTTLLLPRSRYSTRG